MIGRNSSNNLGASAVAMLTSLFAPVLEEAGYQFDTDGRLAISRKNTALGLRQAASSIRGIVNTEGLSHDEVMERTHLANEHAGRMVEITILEGEFTPDELGEVLDTSWPKNKRRDPLSLATFLDALADKMDPPATLPVVVRATKDEVVAAFRAIADEAEQGGDAMSDDAHDALVDRAEDLHQLAHGKHYLTEEACDALHEKLKQDYPDLDPASALAITTECRALADLIDWMF